MNTMNPALPRALLLVLLSSTAAGASSVRDTISFDFVSAPSTQRTRIYSAIPMAMEMSAVVRVRNGVHEVRSYTTPLKVCARTASHHLNPPSLAGMEAPHRFDHLGPRRRAPSQQH